MTIGGNFLVSAARPRPAANATTANKTNAPIALLIVISFLYFCTPVDRAGPAYGSFNT